MGQKKTKPRRSPRTTDRFFARFRARRPDQQQWIFHAPNSVLHLLAQGGRIELTRDADRKIANLQLFTREGWAFSGLDIMTFRKLKQKRAIRSQGGRPYRITERGLVLVRAEQDNR